MYAARVSEKKSWSLRVRRFLRSPHAEERDFKGYVVVIYIGAIKVLIGIMEKWKVLVRV